MKKSGGYPLPDVITQDGELCVSFRIPNIPDISKNVLGHIWQLGTWIVWDKSKDPTDYRATDVAERFRKSLYDSIVIGECDSMNCCSDIQLLVRINQSILEGQRAGEYDDYQTLVNEYRASANPEQDISPSLVTPSEQGNKSICYAAHALIDIICETEKERRRQEANAFGAAALGLITAAGILTLGIGLPIGIAIGAVFTTIGTAISALAFEVLSDESARDELACLMRDRLINAAPSQATFEAALNPSAGLSVNAELIRAAASPALADENVYATWLKLLEDGYQAEGYGTLPACQCPEPIPVKQNIPVFGRGYRIDDSEFVIVNPTTDAQYIIPSVPIGSTVTLINNGTAIAIGDCASSYQISIEVVYLDGGTSRQTYAPATCVGLGPWQLGQVQTNRQLNLFGYGAGGFKILS